VSEPDITPGDSWVLAPVDGLGTGIGAIPAGADVLVTELLPPFSPGIAQVDEMTVCCTYTYDDYAYNDSGVLVEEPNTRRLAFCVSDFLDLFVPSGGGV
jgi:hypothetical protein